MVEKWRQLLGGMAVAVAIGLIEAAWTGPGRGAPTSTWLGVVAILIVLLVVTFPKPWLIPALAILEEVTHLFVGYGWALPTYSTVFNHWSIGYLGVNIAPYLLFPALTLVGEVLYQYRKRRAVPDPKFI